MFNFFPDHTEDIFKGLREPTRIMPIIIGVCDCRYPQIDPDSTAIICRNCHKPILIENEGTAKV